MTKVGSHAHRVLDVVEDELGNEWGLLEQKGHRLAYATASSQDCHFSLDLP